MLKDQFISHLDAVAYVATVFAILQVWIKSSVIQLKNVSIDTVGSRPDLNIPSLIHLAYRESGQISSA